MTKKQRETKPGPDNRTHSDSKRRSAIGLISTSITPKKAALFLFLIYLFAGLLLVKDYGISFDEPQERLTSMANYVYVMGDTMRASEKEAVRAAADSAPALSTWNDRFYGTALQDVTVAIEHMFSFRLSQRSVYLLRHIFTFLNYFGAGLCFYLILKRRFGDTYIPLLGALFYILYPRFFGEAFYNIKDVLYFSWCVIACYFVLLWLENKRKTKFCLTAAAAIALATNTRVLGLSLLLLACAFAVIQEIREKGGVLRAVFKPLLLCVLTFVFYVAFTPFLWENPIGNTAAIFSHFLHFQPWNGTHLYLGEMITREVPWHYLPVWMGVSIPLLYWILFLIGIAVLSTGVILWLKRTAQNRKQKIESAQTDQSSAQQRLHLYDFFFAVLFFFTLFGYILLRISIYEGWRHAYALFLPFLYFAVYGLRHINGSLQRHRHRALRWALACVVTASLGFQLQWIVRNHPYEYVYFNVLGRQTAAQDFSLDYWDVSHTDLVRYALARDDRPQITVNGSTRHSIMMSGDEQARVVWTDEANAEYYLQTSRIAYDERVAPEGFDKVTAIVVDGMEISTLYRRTPQADFDDGAWERVVWFSSNVNTSDFLALFDGDYSTRWSTNRPQEAGDYMVFEFGEAVDYDFIVLSAAGAVQEYPRGLAVYVSDDGIEWIEVPVTSAGKFVLAPQPYRFLKLQNNVSDAFFWSVSEMRLGHSK